MNHSFLDEGAAPCRSGSRSTTAWPKAVLSLPLLGVIDAFPFLSPTEFVITVTNHIKTIYINQYTNVWSVF